MPQHTGFLQTPRITGHHHEGNDDHGADDTPCHRHTDKIAGSLRLSDRHACSLPHDPASSVHILPFPGISQASDDMTHLHSQSRPSL